MTRGSNSKGGGKLLPYNWNTGFLQFLSSILLCQALLAEAELLSLVSCGMAYPTRGCTDLWRERHPRKKSHCPPSLRDSPSPLSLLKSHGINFAVHRKSK